MIEPQHPITPPQELLLDWDNLPLSTFEIFVIAAQWGADQELDACCELLKQKGVPAWSLLRSHRRPKPPSLKEQALALLDPSNTYGSITQKEEYRISVTNADTIRRALEALPDD